MILILTGSIAPRSGAEKIKQPVVFVFLELLLAEVLGGHRLGGLAGDYLWRADKRVAKGGFRSVLSGLSEPPSVLLSARKFPFS